MIAPCLRTVLAAAVFAALPSVATAGCDRWGNCYESDGGTTHGYNARTGSTWSSQSDRYGQSGTDSRGNSWSYERSTGSYHNDGTGTSRRHEPSYGRRKPWED